MSDADRGPDDRAEAHSRAFEALVQGADDVVGLLAYATYKQSVREAALAGQALPDRASRSLPPALVAALRSSAEQTLTKVVSDGIAQATPDILSTATIATLQTNQTELLTALKGERQRIEGHITARTGVLSAFLTNLAAWGVTLLIAVAILYLANRPTVESTILRSMDKPETSQRPAGTLPIPQTGPTKE